MIVTFKSRASGDVIMFGEVAEQMMRLMGKAVTAQGIITVDQLPAAIAGLRAAVHADRARHAQSLQPQEGAGQVPEADAPACGEPPISLTRRAIPLLELLERSQQKKQPVLWGV